MANGAKLLGHYIHPMLIPLPLGVLAMSVVFDIIALATGQSAWAFAAFYMIIAGVIAGLLAAIFGLIDWLAIGGGTRAKSIGAWHGIGNVGVVLLFFLGWLMRRGAPDHPSGAALTLSVLGAGLALVTGWLGGELVERMAVGVDDGAHANSPSSLSGKPASEGRRAG
jgi:uncharacterized membrane protein